MPIDEDFKATILKNISLSGAVDIEENARVETIVGSSKNLDNVISRTSGLPIVKPNLIKKFDMILNQPSSLGALNPFEIRCCICRKVITYPAWYYRLAFVITQIHYFICFDKTNPDKPTTRCYKRG